MKKLALIISLGFSFLNVSFGKYISPEIFVLLSNKDKLSTKKLSEKFGIRSFEGYNEVVSIILEANPNDKETIEFLRTNSIYFRKYPGSNFFSAQVLLSKLESFVNFSKTKFITLGKKLEKRLDVVNRTLEVDYINFINPSKYQGNGVIIGIIDTGLELSHPDFKNTDNSTRVLYLWDHHLSGRSPSGFNYGSEYSSNDINSGNVTSRDYEGHGTHVSGIAGGNGKASNLRYKGIAPSANFIIVKTLLYENNILDSIEYIIKKSRELNKPCVINLSLGTDIGPHDGKDYSSIIIKSMLDFYGRQGIVVVNAGGNSGNTKIHVSSNISSVLPTTFTFNIPSNSTEDTVIADFWANGNYNVQVKITKGFNDTGWFTPSSSDIFSWSGVDIYVSAQEYQYNGDKNINIQINEKNNTGGSGNWTIQFKTTSGTTTIHGWGIASFSDFGFNQGDDNYTVGGLFLIDDIITVSSYNTKSAITNPINIYNPGYITNGQISYFSSKGPTRDGRQKPDISAPGAFIVSAKSKYMEIQTEYLDRFYSNYYVALMGTSMACPVITGLSAILLGIQPNLTTTDVLNYLKSSAKTSIYDPNGSAWDPSWGWGIANIKEIISNIATNEGNLVWIEDNIFSSIEQSKKIRLRFNLSEDDTVYINIYNAFGELVKTVSNGEKLNKGLNTIEINISSRDFRRGIYFVKVNSSKINEKFEIIVK